MTNFLAPLLSFLLLYKYWAFFLIIFIASAAIPIPIGSLLLATGAFASQGYFNFPLSLVVGIGANTLGDLCGYFVARIYGRRILEIFHIHTPSYIEQLEARIRLHPGITIFVTRFAGTTDVLGNLLSGFIGIPFGTFLFYDIVGDSVSTGYMMVAGYFLGSSWQNFLQFFSITGWIILGIIIAVLVTLTMWYKKGKRS